MRAFPSSLSSPLRSLYESVFLSWMFRISAPAGRYISDMLVFCWSNGNEKLCTHLEYRSPSVSIRADAATFGSFG